MIDRRDWLLVVGGGLLAACSPSSKPSEVTPNAPGSKAIDSKAPDSKAAASKAAPGTCQLTLTRDGKKLGHLYRIQTPAETTLKALKAALPRGPAALKAKIKAEYVADDVLVLQGWILARTEARLLALGTLQGGCATL